MECDADALCKRLGKLELKACFLAVVFIVGVRSAQRACNNRAAGLYLVQVVILNGICNLSKERAPFGRRILPAGTSGCKKN